MCEWWLSQSDYLGSDAGVGSPPQCSFQHQGDYWTGLDWTDGSVGPSQGGSKD